LWAVRESGDPLGGQPRRRGSERKSARHRDPLPLRWKRWEGFDLPQSGPRNARVRHPKTVTVRDYGNREAAIRQRQSSQKPRWFLREGGPPPSRDPRVRDGRRGPYRRRSRRQAPFGASRSLCHGTCAVWLRAIDSFGGTSARSSVGLTVHEPPWSRAGFPAPLRSARPDPGSGRLALAARPSLAGEWSETAVRRPPFGWADTGRASLSDDDFARFRTAALRSDARWLQIARH
jgi:hypothetical protein